MTDGAQILGDDIAGGALRSLRAPGTAYDDDLIGGIRVEDGLDTAELPPRLARRAETVLCRERLAAAKRAGAPVPDAASHDVRLRRRQGPGRLYRRGTLHRPGSRRRHR